MATYTDSSKKMVTCPYDPAHRMLNSRLQQHITKCKLNHLDVKLATCPFNAQHLEKEANLQYHISNCPDRISLDRQLTRGVYENELSKGRTAVPSYTESLPYVSSENWDNEIDVNPSAGYIPKGPIQSNSIIGDLGMTKPSERKRIYRQPPSAYAEPAKPVEVEKPKPKQEPMRQPKLTAEALHAMMKSMTPPQQPSKPKIAANIFGPSPTSSRQPVASYKNLLSEMNTLNLGIGRGRGALAKNYDTDFPRL